MKKQSKVHYIFSQILAACLFLPGRFFSIFTILLLSVFVLTQSKSYSQKGSMELSVFAGPNYSSMRGNSMLEDSTEAKICFSSGLGVHYNILDYLGVRTGISCERKGISGTKRIFYDDIYSYMAYVNHNERFDYLSIPVVIRVQFGDKFRFFANAGAYWAYLIKQTAEITDPYFTNETLDNTHNFNKSDYGIVGGIGSQYQLKKFNYTCVNEKSPSL